jgi:hypothetical protein
MDDHQPDHQENIALAEFASGAHANAMLLCDTCSEVPISRVPMKGPHAQWAVRFTCNSERCSSRRNNFWFGCKICRTKSKQKMCFPSDLTRHIKSKEHLGQSQLLLSDQDSYSDVMEEDTISAGPSQPAPAAVQNWSVVDRACSLLPVDILKAWMTDYAPKQSAPQDFLDLFPPTSERGGRPSNKNALYFVKQHERQLGPASVAAYALHHDRTLSSQMDPASVLFTHLMAYLGGRLRSDKDRVLLAALLSHAVDSSVAASQSTSAKESTPIYKHYSAMLLIHRWQHLRARVPKNLLLYTSSYIFHLARKSSTVPTLVASFQFR